MVVDKAKILIVEDESVTAMEIEDKLTSLGYNISGIVSSGEQALQKVKNDEVDLILMDIKLKGDLDGIETAKIIHKEHNLPVVYLTAYADEGMMQRAKTTEPYGYLLKPFKEREVQTQIEIAIYKNKMEEELYKIDKLESIGVLAGGIAHDFNNLLTIIMGNIQLSKMYTTSEEVLEKLQETEKASMRAKDLTQRLLSLAKGGLSEKEVTSIGKVIRETSELSLSGSNVDYEFDIPNDLWLVDADEGQISQVVQNLVVNADQAMPLGGKLRISANNVVIKEEDSLPLKEGKYIKLTFQDQGEGISQKHIKNIFDPYFTTKNRGVEKGTGLGLSVCHSIVKKHDGYINVESEVEEGTTFYVYLPASKQQKISPIKSEQETVFGKGRVLVMDDDEMVRNMAREIIDYLGYSTDFASNGKEVVNKYQHARQNKRSYDIVILDLTVRGGLGAKDTIAKLLEIDKNVNAIVTSGYSNDPIMNNYEKYGFKSAFAKPYQIKKLSQVLSKLSLDE
ncbi:MAG: response regulator [Candidatus Marinimicrobia bacterium]|nr:response regulator [Candidatus Neomarinimicrobiota bacterium]